MGTVSYTQWDVWKKSHELALATYRVTESYPAKERHRMTDPSCRAAVSVAGNIAEGYGRRKPRDKMRFYTHSEGSLQELKYYFILARDLGYLPQPAPLFQLIVDIESMLRKLIASIESSIPTPAPKSAGSSSAIGKVSVRVDPGDASGFRSILFRGAKTTRVKGSPLCVMRNAS